VTTAAKPELISTRDERELAKLRQLSARVGVNPLLVQASNGNTSIKLDATMWIKASGKLLANAAQEEIFLAVNLLDESDMARAGSSADLCPSIETPMHTAIPHRVVIHVHSINAIAWAIRTDGRPEIEDRLEGLRWQWIPYAASGKPLAREVGKAVTCAPETDVFILGSHGLVVCGQDCDSAGKLLAEVDWRLAIPPRKIPVADVTALKTSMARFPGWQIPDDGALHALATDALCRKILKDGVLYPCQATFLGQTMPVIAPETLESGFVEWLAAHERIPPFVAVAGMGVIVSEKITAAERVTLRGLAEVTLRPAGTACLRYLSAAEVAEVLHIGAHGAEKVPATREKVFVPLEVPVEVVGWEQERRIRYSINACAAWLGSHARRLSPWSATQRSARGI